MALDLEKARLMSALARGKANWGAAYDRMEHFKRFQNLKDIIKDLSKIGWVIIHKKPGFEAISLNPKHKKEIIGFIEEKIPELRGVVK
ncbi:MAG: hypothetical protein AABW93_03355 [Nanoarchaeota archaeon]|mgnify:FL=1